MIGRGAEGANWPGPARHGGALVLGIDQGTSGSKAIVLDEASRVLGTGYRAVGRLHPRSGWTEQDPVAIATGVREAIGDALAHAGARPAQIAAVGIAGQRNSGFTWDPGTCRPFTNAISWQDLRTGDLLRELRAHDPIWSESLWRLGQRPGPWNASAHLGWRMRHDPAFANAARAGRIRFGLSAEWLLVALGSPREHAMDYSLVDSQGLFDIREDRYWPELLDWLGVPPEILPEPRPSLHDYGTLRVESHDGEHADVPVLAMLADQQAALFGYDCRAPGDAECTHGTATFVDVCVGSKAPAAQRMQSYYAWVLPHSGRPGDVDSLDRTYCLEGDATVTGAVIRWLRETVRLLDDEKEIGPLAATVEDAGGVMFVPAFTGLNVPYLDSDARGSILGLTLGSSRGQIARAFLDSLGFQVRAITDEVAAETGVAVTRLKVGGGISASDLACQLQADWLGFPVARPAFTDTTPRAAALLAGLGAGVWSTLDALPQLPGETTTFEPRLSADARDAGFERWHRAVESVRRFGTGGS
jgi:glycerol kinase